MGNVVGIYTIRDRHGHSFELRNKFTVDGWLAVMYQYFRNENYGSHTGASLYVGLCSMPGIAPDATLADITDEPSPANSYARQALSIGTGWDIDGIPPRQISVRSPAGSFTVSGGDYDETIRRTFLCTVASGTSGILLSVSHETASPVTFTPGDSPYAIDYRMYFAS